ncbi:hypothetical protein BD410DRAFT_797319 [Rickenella mellea]|uniref:Uncharacterized protein n=1 Tax=Rickenella mellea TaxID=50990 RepID=A0A4Y7PFE3_9AGAM|nr:hypothetical protein BD410DRAFT_797319 [Rickenella mellea]
MELLGWQHLFRDTGPARIMERQPTTSKASTDTSATSPATTPNPRHPRECPAPMRSSSVTVASISAITSKTK